MLVGSDVSCELSVYFLDYCFPLFSTCLKIFSDLVGRKTWGKKSMKKVIMSAEMQDGMKQLVWKRINHLSWN